VAAILIGYDVESAAVGEGLARFLSPETPQYLYALEPESTRRGLEVIRRVHSELEAPGTLFVCGRTLLHSLEPLHEAADSGLLDVQQHTYSHVVFRDVEFTAEGGSGTLTLPESPPLVLREELGLTSELVRKYFGHACVGLRTPFGYYRGLRGRTDLLGIVAEAGLRYVTSWGRNEQNGNPSPLDVQPFAYDEEGFPDLLEIPFQFWLDAIWFDANGWENGDGFRRVLEHAIDEAAERDAVYGTCFHDWAVLAADEERTGWIRGAIEHARERRVEVLGYTDYWRRTADESV
jgi:peptidoglycan/xylan/chitin deacetylase (PgdA/CDA1 family)